MTVAVKIPTMLSEILQRIESRIQALGTDAANASLEAGLSNSAIRNLQRAVKEKGDGAGVNSSTLFALAPVLQTTPAWLLEGIECGVENVPAEAQRLWTLWKIAMSAPPEVQDRIAEFAEFQLSKIQDKSLDTATKVAS